MKSSIVAGSHLWGPALLIQAIQYRTGFGQYRKSSQKVTAPGTSSTIDTKDTKDTKDTGTLTRILLRAYF